MPKTYDIKLVNDSSSSEEETKDNPGSPASKIAKKRDELDKNFRYAASKARD